MRTFFMIHMGFQGLESLYFHTPIDHSAVFTLRWGKKASRFWKPVFNHLIQAHIGLEIFLKFGQQMFEKN